MNNPSNAKESQTRQITIALAQIGMTVGDVPGNTRRVIETAHRARDQLHAQLVVFPECTLTGYPPEDLLFHKQLRRQVADGLDTLVAELEGVQVLVGYPEYTGQGIYNSLTLIGGGKQSVNYRKKYLPNFAVFDEERYFLAGDEAKTIDIGGIRLGPALCEDIWHAGTVEAARDIGAEALIITNGSPYEIRSQSRRRALLAERSSGSGMPVSGSDRVTPPTLRMSWKAIQASTPVASSDPNLSGARRTICSPRHSSTTNSPSTTVTPMKPISSPMIANTPSVCDPGT